MPQVHLYIRNEDVEKWKALPNKSEFVHNALNSVTAKDVADISLSGRVKLYDEIKPIKTLTPIVTEKIKQQLEDEFKYGDGSGKPFEYTRVSEHVIKSPKDAKKAVEKKEFISKEFSARKKK